MTMLSRPTGYILLLTLAACGCAAPDGQPRNTVSDSAGVEIVTSRAPSWGPNDRWDMDSAPMVEIGTVDGDTEYLFDRIRGVVVLDDGGVAVANEGTATIRFFDAHGDFLFERGGKGGGPEEFFQIMGLYRLGDRIVAQQWGQNPTRTYTLDGTLMESFPSAAPGLPSARVIKFFEDGASLAMEFPQGMGITEPTVQDARFYVSTAGDTNATQAMLSLPAIRWVLVDRMQAPQDLGPLLHVEVGANQIYYGWPEDYDVQVFDRNGLLIRRIRRAWEPVPIQQEHIDIYERLTLEADRGSGGPPPDAVVERRRSILDQMVYPEHFGAFDGMRIDRRGNLWIRTIDEPDFARYVTTSAWPVPSVPADWDVFDTTGVWLGSIRLPARFQVFEIGDDYVAGVWRNELGVEFVHVYALRKPGSS